MGRFTTADPYEASAALTDPQTWNRYAYVANDPISRLDRNGLWMTSVHNEYGDGYYICGISLWENPFSGWANICGYGPFSEEMFYLHQGAGGGSGDVNILSAQEMSRLYNSAFGAAKSIFEKSANCRNLFPGLTGARSGGVAQIFSQLMSDSGGRGAIKISTSQTMLPKYGMQVGTKTTTLFGFVISREITLEVNARSDSSFVSPSGYSGYAQLITSGMSSQEAITQLRAEALIHEFGHIVEKIFGKDATLIQDDENDDPASIANNALVAKNCR